jgi:PP-loop superfamily ATP-utilizing enzyme
MKIAENTPTREITIQGFAFSVPAPFSEGHTVTAGEASALNQTLAENIRNNLAKTIDKAVEAAAKANAIDVKDVTAGHLDLDELQGKVNEYVQEYEFGVRAGGGRNITDPVEREAMNIARTKVREALKSKGYVLAEIPKETIDKLAEDLVEANPAITDEAKRRVESTKSFAVGEIDLGAVTGKAA